MSEKENRESKIVALLDKIQQLADCDGNRLVGELETVASLLEKVHQQQENWKENFWDHKHSMFIVFMELKILGSWTRSPQRNMEIKGNFMVSTDDRCKVEIIESDGLHRTLSFKQDAFIVINQNVLTYNPDEVKENPSDEKEQAGKGKTRDILH